MALEKTVLSVDTSTPIPYSFKTLTYRRFQAVVEKLEDARATKDNRSERNRLNEEAAEALIDNAKQLLDEASNADVQRLMVEAIEFNQGTDTDAKKSE